jgi:hypothetical protein
MYPSDGLNHVYAISGNIKKNCIKRTTLNKTILRLKAMLSPAVKNPVCWNPVKIEQNVNIKFE